MQWKNLSNITSHSGYDSHLTMCSCVLPSHVSQLFFWSLDWALGNNSSLREVPTLLHVISYCDVGSEMNWNGKFEMTLPFQFLSGPTSQ